MMTHFDVEDVTRIARDAAREHSPSITVAGMVLGAGGSDYVEILVNLEGCRADPCQFSLGLPKRPVDTLKSAIAEQLRRHVEQHRGAQKGEVWPI
jgi:hypothetical protein